jgi:predicted phosphoribosyltransferase
MRFRHRAEAGERLAERLSSVPLEAPVILALPRGGVPVGFEVARRLGAPLDVIVSRKVGSPDHPEFGIGAIAEGGVVVADETALRMLGITQEGFDALALREQPELDRRVRLYRGDRALPDLERHDVVLVDDGLATGVTAHAAIRSLERAKARRVVLAAPVCAADSAVALGRVADEVVCVMTPARFNAVGQWYDDFDQTTDREVLRLLERAAAERVGR